MTEPDVGDALVRDSLLELHAHRPHLAYLKQLYEGTLPERFTSQRVADDLRDVASQYRINLAKKAVSAPLDRTSLSGILVPEQAAQTAISEFRDANEFDFELRQAFSDAYTYGDAYITVLPDADIAGGISAYSHGPVGFRMFYRPDRPRQASHAIHSYIFHAAPDDEGLVTGERYLAAVVYTPFEIQRWVTRNALSIDGYVDYGSVPLRLVGVDPAPIEGVIPAFHLRTARPYGRSRLEDVAGTQEVLNTLVTTLMAAVTAAGYRQRYLISGKKPGALADNFIAPTAPDDGEDVESSRYQAGPDTILHFAGESVEVGSFEVTNSSNFLEPIDAVAGFMAKLSDTPESFYRASSQPQSGESYRQSARPLTAVVADFQQQAGAALSSLFEYVLELRGVKLSPVQVSWTAQELVDSGDWWGVAQQKVALGVPTPVILTEAGYSEETIEAWAESAKAAAAAGAE